MTTYFLSDAQLATMRSDVARMLPGTAIIHAFVAAANSAGEWSETWTAVSGGTVACRLDPIKAQNIVMAGGAEGFKVDYQLTLPYDAPIDVGHRVTYAGNAYEVRQLSDLHSWNVSVRAQVSKVT